MGDFLWSIVPWGYQVLLGLEGIRCAPLDFFFSMVTDLGSEVGYLVLLSLVYWCISKPLGHGLTFAYLFTATLNVWIKDTWRIPRPDDAALEGVLQQAGVARRLSPRRHEISPSFVSGHTQGAVVTWGYMAQGFKKAWFWVVAAIVIALIAFSRMYLGVHFPQDVIGGLAVGALYLFVWLWAEARVGAWLAALSSAWHYALVVGVPLAVLALHPVEDTATAMGAAMGLGVGFVLEGQTLRFIVKDSWRRRALRGALGLAVMLAVYLGLSALFGLFDASTTSPVPIRMAMQLVWRVVRYALLGFVGAWIIPWLFTLSGLARKGEAAHAAFA